MGRGRVGWGPLWSLGDQKKKKTKSNRVTCICRCLCDVEQLNADWLLSTPHPRRFPCFATFQNSTTRLLDPTTNGKPRSCTSHAFMRSTSPPVYSQGLGDKGK